MIIKPPTYYKPEKYFSGHTPTTIFLAGTIDMGHSENWQQTVSEKLSKENFVVFNPRRDDWDSSWEQSIYNSEFNKQVNWELDHLSLADLIIFNFLPDSKSPITLMELGLFIDKKHRNQLFVICPDEFYRKGNVDIVCHRHNVHVYKSLEDAGVL